MASNQVTFYCPREEWEAFMRHAKKTGKSASELLREMMKARVTRAGRKA